LAAGKESSSFLKYSARPDSDFTASPFRHRDARTKKLFLIRAMGAMPPTPIAESNKSLFASFSSEKEGPY
jgi:hypothetical protein